MSFKNPYVPFIVLLLSTLGACQSTGDPTSISTPNAPQTAPSSSSANLTNDGTTQSTHSPDIPHTLDFKSLTESAVNIYNAGYDDFVLEDIMPILSDASSYTQKWEFYIYTRPYQTRIKFEISNFAFSKNEGKVKGYVREFDNDVEKANYPISVSLKNGQWKAEKDRLKLQFGEYSLEFKNNAFFIAGVFDEGKGSFQYEIPLHAWKPGTGNVYFGNSPKNIFKYSILTYQQPVPSGTVTLNGMPVQVTGTAYGNHYATTVAIYDMFDEVADSRKYTDDVFVEFRYYVPSQKYDAPPFGFLFTAFEGIPVFSASEIQRTPLETWIDDKFYGYQIDSRQQIDANDAENPQNRATLRMTSAAPEASDPYANLPAFQRNVATRFAKPIEYSIPIEYELDIDADGNKAKIPISSSYSVTRLR